MFCVSEAKDVQSFDTKAHSALPKEPKGEVVLQPTVETWRHWADFSRQCHRMAETEISGAVSGSGRLVSRTVSI